MTKTHNFPAYVTAVLVLASASGASSETPLSNAARAVELPFHRTLQEMRLSENGQLAPFTTDGCSGGLSESWKLVANTFPGFAKAHTGQPPWEECCVTHDRAYHTAGPSADPDNSFRTRLLADRTLEACVQNTGKDRLQALAAQYNVEPEQVQLAYETIAGAMFTAVRFGGMPCSGLPWRWGYGFPPCNALALTRETNE